MSERFTASIKWEHADEISSLYFRAKGGDRTLTEADIVLIGNFAGALNAARAGANPPAPPAPPVPTPTPTPTPPPVADWPVERQDPYIVGVSGTGVNGPKLIMEPGRIYAIPIVLPTLPGVWEWSMCEFQGEPAPHTARLSLFEGDLPAPRTDYNLTPSIRIVVDDDGPYKTGSTVYVNACVSEGFPRATPVHYDVLFRTS